MEIKKSMLILIMAIFLVSIAGVCASDANDTQIASEDTAPIEIAQSDEISVNEDSQVLEQSNNEENVGTFTELQHNITEKYGSTLELDRNYEYEENFDISEIKIEDKIIIDGKGHTIDAKGKARVFNVSASDVTIKNLTIKNAYSNDNGGAIYFNKNANLANCNFTNNTATNGGAVYFSSLAHVNTVENCKFDYNTASEGGGAIRFSGEGSLTNCIFTDNNATNNGGAVYFAKNSEMTNCNFTSNDAGDQGGAVYFSDNGRITGCKFSYNNATNNGGAVYFSSSAHANTVENCKFDHNTASEGGGAIRFSGEGSLTNCIFTDNIAIDEDYGRGGAAYFNGNANLTNCNFTDNIATNQGGAVYFRDHCNLTACNFANNTASKTGGAAYFYRYLTGNAIDCNFTNNKVTGAGSSGGAIYFDTNSTSSIIKCNFADNEAAKSGGAVFFDSNGDVSNSNFVNNSAYSDGGAIYFNRLCNVSGCNFTGNSAQSRGGALYFNSLCNVSKCNFTNNNALNGGAILASAMSYANVSECVFGGNSAFNGGAAHIYAGAVEKCNFAQNHATNTGGAVIFNEEGRLADCNFTANAASRGGAASMFAGNVKNCNFTGNNATRGSAIVLNGFSDTNITNSCFLNNRANASENTPLNVTVNGNTIEITFMGQNNLLNAIYSYGNVSFTNVTYWGANGIGKTGDGPVVLSPSNREAGQNISITGVVNGNVLKTTKITDDNGKVIVENVQDYYLVICHEGDSYYTEAEKTISNMYVNVTSKTSTNRTVNITAKSNIPQDIIGGKLQFILPDGTPINATYGANGTWWALHSFDASGEYNVTASYIGLNDVTVNNATITVNKIKTQLLASDVTATYNIGRNLVITLKDANGNPLTDIELTVSLDVVKTLKTDKNGQVNVSTEGLIPKTYTAKITFSGNALYDMSTKEVKVTVKKAKPKLTAKAKKFKKSKKVKKYAVTLKDNTKKPIQKAKLTLKIKGKKFKAKTNAKGKATFKIKKLTKKGTYRAKVIYKENKYYTKASITVKIKIR